MLNQAKYSGKKIVSINDDVSEETIACIIHKCVENEHINDYSKIIILNVLPSVNFHHQTFSPKKKVLPPVYHNPKIEKGTSHEQRVARETGVTKQTNITRCYCLHSNN
jgi:hypothetical protein